MYKHTTRRPDGQVTLSDPDGGIQQFDTHQCPHCGGHFEIRPGSGTRRTFCMRCGKVTCGNLACDACIPTEALIEHLEGTRTQYDDLIEVLLGR